MDGIGNVQEMRACGELRFLAPGGGLHVAAVDADVDRERVRFVQVGVPDEAGIGVLTPRGWEWLALS